MINSRKWAQLRHKMLSLDIQENDLQERFIIGSGRGGQNKHKTASCVYLCHKPTGIELKCQEDRQRENNRFLARRRLCKKIETLYLKEKSEEAKAIAKIRHQKKRRSRRTQQKILDEKHHQSDRKQFRKKTNGNLE